MNAAVKTPAAKTTTAAGNDNKSFWENLQAHASPIAKLTSGQAQVDPKLAMRTRFEKAVAEQVKLVKSAADKSRWFKKLPDGSYELTVRNGNTAMAERQQLLPGEGRFGCCLVLRGGRCGHQSWRAGRATDRNHAQAACEEGQRSRC